MVKYALDGDNKDLGEFFFLQGRLFFSADASGTYTIIATDADGDRATISIDYTIPNSDVSIANALVAQAHKGNDGNVEVNLAGVFAGDSDLTLTSGDGTIANNTLTIDTAKLEGGDNTIRVTAKDGDGDIAVDTFVLTVDKSPTLDAAIADATLAAGNDGAIIDVSGVFGHPTAGEVLALTASAGKIGTDGMLTLLEAELADGANTIMLTATDSDLTSAESVTSTFVVTTDKSPTILTALADETVVGNSATIDLAGLFDNGTGNLTLTASLLGSNIGSDRKLTLSDTVFTEGTHVITITATDTNNDAVEAIVELVSDKTPTVVASISDNDMLATNHSNTTIDVAPVFDGGSGNLAYAVNALAGVSITNSELTINYSDLGAGIHTVTVTATDSDAQNADSTTDEFILEVLNYDSTLNDNLLSFESTLLGTTYGDAITGNAFSASTLSLVDLDGGAGNDTISGNVLIAVNYIVFITFAGGAGDDTIIGNALSASVDVLSITFAGGAGDDFISTNTLTASDDIYSVTFDGGDGNDTIISNALTASDDINNITFVGGAGDDTISNSTFTASDVIYNITFEGGDGNDTIISNTLTASNDISGIILAGGAGDDLFANNVFQGSDTADVTIDGGVGEDTVMFRSIAGEYAGLSDWINVSDGGGQP